MTHGRLRPSRIAIAAILSLFLIHAQPAHAVDISQVPLWDAETSATNNPLMNRFGGQPNHQGGTLTQIQRDASAAHAGLSGYRVDTLGTIPAGGFGFFQTALAPAASGVQPGRDLRGFDQTSFWIRNTTGSSFNLKFEIKDYRDSGAHVAWRNIPITASSSWRQIQVPLDFNQAGWNRVGSPDLSRARLLSFVMEANQGQSITGSLALDDLRLSEVGGTLDTQTATTSQLAGRLAERQFRGLWGARNPLNSLIPNGSTSSSVGAINSTAAMVKMLPTAVQLGWIGDSEANGYMQTLVTSLNASMNGSTYLPPRYLNMNNLSPAIAEESVVDTAFLALALHQYKRRPETPAALANLIDALQNRFDFAAFSDTNAPNLGWKLAYNPVSHTFTSGTYDGYSGEPWLISLAAELSTQHHVDIETHYHSAVFRTSDYLVNPADAHLVHSFDNFRAPFLQWLMPIFADVSERGVDTYPVRTLATNPLENAQKYQRDVHAYFAGQGRGALLQPDAGDDGSGSFYQQFSAYNDFGRSDLLMPWSVGFSLLGDQAIGDVALRNHLAHQLQGPFGLSDSARWSTGASDPSSFVAGNDLWNTSLSTLALMQFLYGGNERLSSLPEVADALDRVFFLTWDGQAEGPWLTNQWNGGQAPPTARHDARILAGMVRAQGTCVARRFRVQGGTLAVEGLLLADVEVQAAGTIQGAGQVVGNLDLAGVLELGASELRIDGDVSLDPSATLGLDVDYSQAIGSFDSRTVLSATGSILGQFDNPSGPGAAAHLGEDFFLSEIEYLPHEVVATILRALPGDANGDGLVDGTDFNIWNANKFLVGTDWTTGDFTGDGVTDGSDFNVWNSHKFTSVLSLVPEPSSAIGSVFLAAMLLVRPTRKRIARTK